MNLSVGQHEDLLALRTGFTNLKVKSVWCKYLRYLSPISSSHLNFLLLSESANAQFSSLDLLWDVSDGGQQCLTLQVKLIGKAAGPDEGPCVHIQKRRALFYCGKNIQITVQAIAFDCCSSGPLKYCTFKKNIEKKAATKIACSTEFTKTLF